MKENVLKSFIRDTYKNTSSIPYIITGQVCVFILLHIFELLTFDEVVSLDLFKWTSEHLSLPMSMQKYLQQPWALITHPFLYQGIFNLLFDCLWLYWIGNIFLNFLNNRQFLTVFLGGIILGGLLFVGISSLPFYVDKTGYWNTTALGLAALISSVTLLVPNLEVRLFIFGNVKLKTIAAIYLALEFGFLMVSTPVAAIAYLFMVCFGACFMWQLQKGNDWSRFLKKGKRRQHLKVVKNQHYQQSVDKGKGHHSDLPNQELVDQILDKISVSGYESLNTQEKEILFKASKQD